MKRRLVKLRSNDQTETSTREELEGGAQRESTWSFVSNTEFLSCGPSVGLPLEH